MRRTIINDPLKPMNVQMWRVAYTYQPVITKEQIAKVTRRATIWERVRLLLHKSQYSIGEDSIIRYKQMNGKTYVMRRGTKL